MSDLITAGTTREKADALAVAVVPYLCHMGEAVCPIEKKITETRVEDLLSAAEPPEPVRRRGGVVHGPARQSSPHGEPHGPRPDVNGRNDSRRREYDAHLASRSAQTVLKTGARHRG